MHSQSALPDQLVGEDVSSLKKKGNKRLSFDPEASQNILLFAQRYGKIKAAAANVSEQSQSHYSADLSTKLNSESRAIDVNKKLSRHGVSGSDIAIEDSDSEEDLDIDPLLVFDKFIAVLDALLSRLDPNDSSVKNLQAIRKDESLTSKEQTTRIIQSAKRLDAIAKSPVGALCQILRKLEVNKINDKTIATFEKACQDLRGSSQKFFLQSKPVDKPVGLMAVRLTK